MNFFQTVQHGFPSKPTAVAWDPVLRLIALGTQTGVIKVYPFCYKKKTSLDLYDNS